MQQTDTRGTGRRDSSSDRPTLAVLDPANSRKLIGCIRARDAFALASSILDAQRREDLGVGS